MTWGEGMLAMNRGARFTTSGTSLAVRRSLLVLLQVVLLRVGVCFHVFGCINGVLSEYCCDQMGFRRVIRVISRLARVIRVVHEVMSYQLVHCITNKHVLRRELDVESCRVSLIVFVLGCSMPLCSLS